MPVALRALSVISRTTETTPAFANAAMAFGSDSRLCRHTMIRPVTAPVTHASRVAPRNSAIPREAMAKRPGVSVSASCCASSPKTTTSMCRTPAWTTPRALSAEESAPPSVRRARRCTPIAAAPVTIAGRSGSPKGSGPYRQHVGTWRLTPGFSHLADLGKHLAGQARRRPALRPHSANTRRCRHPPVRCTRTRSQASGSSPLASLAHSGAHALRPGCKAPTGRS